MRDREDYRRQFEDEADRFSEQLAEAALHAGERPPFSVWLVKLGRDVRGSWEAKRMTLSNHVQVGAYAGVKQEDGSRWVYTTSQGHAQTSTLQRWTDLPIEEITANTYEGLRDLLHRSFLQAMEQATTDGRSRRITIRGFDYGWVHQEQEEARRWGRVADGLEDLSEEDVSVFLQWWDNEVSLRIERAAGGLPVSRRIYQMAERQRLVDIFKLVEGS